MNRLKEIEKRMADIKVDLEKDDANLQELETEFDELVEERKSIITTAEKRQNLLTKVANGELGTVLETGEQRKGEKLMEDNILESKEYRSGFFKKLMGQTLSETEERAMTSASDSVGTAIPTQTLNAIDEKLSQISALYPYITVLNIPGNLSIPAEDTTNDASWVTEGTDSTDSNDKITAISLGAYTLIKTIEITANVKAMSVNAFEKYIVKKLSEKMAIAIENAILNGTGVNQPTGILVGITYGEANSVSYTTAVSYDNICDAKALLKSGYNGKFTMNSKTLWSGIAKIKDDNKQPIFIIDPTGTFVGRLLGSPVIINEYCPDGVLVLGDFSKFDLNFSEGISIASNDSVGFRSGKRVYRGMALLDGKVVNTEAFVKIYKTLGSV